MSAKTSEVADSKLQSYFHSIWPLYRNKEFVFNYFRPKHNISSTLRATDTSSFPTYSFLLLSGSFRVILVSSLKTIIFISNFICFEAYFCLGIHAPRRQRRSVFKYNIFPMFFSNRQLVVFETLVDLLRQSKPSRFVLASLALAFSHCKDSDY